MIRNRWAAAAAVMMGFALGACEKGHSTDRERSTPPPSPVPAIGTRSDAMPPGDAAACLVYPQPMGDMSCTHGDIAYSCGASYQPAPGSPRCTASRAPHASGIWCCGPGVAP